MTTTGWILLFVFARLIDLVIWYFLNRGSVRANDQIAMLKEISEKQSAQIDLLIALAHKKETVQCRTPENPFPRKTEAYTIDV
ncbi:YebO family protein, partial [Klebsiella pneumoniae]|uniref:YebO family protein n=1 Tax=Klebsiella pneumoniae TaxID=573 RepID=UPI00298E8AD3